MFDKGIEIVEALDAAHRPERMADDRRDHREAGQRCCAECGHATSREQHQRRATQLHDDRRRREQRRRLQTEVLLLGDRRREVDQLGHAAVDIGQTQPGAGQPGRRRS